MADSCNTPAAAARRASTPVSSADALADGADDIHPPLSVVIFASADDIHATYFVAREGYTAQIFPCTTKTAKHKCGARWKGQNKIILT